MRVLNKTEHAVTVKIIHGNGMADSIQLQPRGGRAAELPAGSILDPSMLAVYASILRTDPPIVVPTPTPAPAVVADAPAEGK